MITNWLFNKIKLNHYKTVKLTWSAYSTIGCTHLQEKILTEDMKKVIEQHWKDRIIYKPFDPSNHKEKCYVLSMFPYPSGELHMGHVRVYSISDTIARFYRLLGRNVFQPMGWDAFGLPAENAAIQRKIPANKWTLENIERMRKQLNDLGCSFDWNSEIATCDPAYYKWTQKIFLMLFNEGLAYQCESMVNWDPVDQTVLADEQVDENGLSWRSGAKVEKKLLKQWFIKTTKFAEQLYAGLDDPILEDWKDIINLQKHWIGECDGWNFSFKLSSDKNITVWSKSPEEFQYATFIAIRKEHLLNTDKIDSGLLSLRAKNPFTGHELPIIVTDEVEFPPFNDVYVSSNNEGDAKIAEKFGLEKSQSRMNLSRDEVLSKAAELNIGGDFKISSKLKDWLISRQRFWGTPIPIIHCPSCGAVPVKDEDLPIKLPENDEVGKPLSQNHEWLKCSCPKCGNTDAKRESDTMDTFVDSSWYFLRYLDPQNQLDLVDKKLGNEMMPVDIYIGGKEHAVLHLYYARFMNHFLHQKGYVKDAEPFKRLLVQGMVKGKTYRVKENGLYLKSNEVEIINEKKGKAVEKETKRKVEVLWEKMSKSKFNGVDPIDVIQSHGCDTTRLIMLGDVAPTSHRNWSEATFPGIIKWQKRLWMTLHDFHIHRQKVNEISISKEFDEHEEKLLDSANYFTSTATFNFKISHQLSIAISRLQGLTNAIRRAPPDVVCFGKQYERALSAQIIMLAPFAPHFSSELWSRFISAPNRVTEKSDYINWNADIFDQQWPKVDSHHKIEFNVKVNNLFIHKFKVTCAALNRMSQDEALHLGLNHESTAKYIKDKKIMASQWKIYEDYEGILNLITDQVSVESTENEHENVKKIVEQ
ncbi:hypothetical protein ACKWTF_008091 [Chironomus riparius]